MDSRAHNEPLTPTEERAWRAIARAVLVIPRALEADLLRDQGLGLTEYKVLMVLSENTGDPMRMTELADLVGVSISGLTRVLDRLVRQGLVERAKCDSDRRGHHALLTPSGLKKLQEAYPSHLASVREHVMDHLVDLDLSALADAFSKIVTAEAETSPRAPRRVAP